MTGMATNTQHSAETSVYRVRTKNFGTLEVRPEQVIHLDPGLLGFSQYHRYVLIEHPKEAPFLWLQSLEKDDLAFVVIDPRFFLPDYRPGSLEQVMEVLEIERPEDLKVLVILTIPPGRPQDMTANLMGPVVINLKTRRGRQIIVEDPPYSHKHRVLPQ